MWQRAIDLKSGDCFTLEIPNDIPGMISDRVYLLLQYNSYADYVDATGAIYSGHLGHVFHVKPEEFMLQEEVVAEFRERIPVRLASFYESLTFMDDLVAQKAEEVANRDADFYIEKANKGQ